MCLPQLIQNWRAASCLSFLPLSCALEFWSVLTLCDPPWARHCQTRHRLPASCAIRAENHIGRKVGGLSHGQIVCSCGCNVATGRDWLSYLSADQCMWRDPTLWQTIAWWRRRYFVIKKLPTHPWRCSQRSVTMNMYHQPVTHKTLLNCPHESKTKKIMKISARLMMRQGGEP